MKTRQELKAIGKAQFKANYWNCVLALLLVSAVIGVLGWLANGQNTQELISNGETVTITVRSGCGSILSLLLGGPLNIGLLYFFVKNVMGATDEISVTTPFTKAFENYPRKLGGSLWMGLFVFLWSLLFIVPGIIKAISYSMTEYILADCPEVKAKDALKLSMRMMNGHKGEYFVLLLSFFGWALLSCLTLGILYVFYTGPYFYNTFAAYYLEIKNEALRTGAVTQEQLDGTMPA